MGDLDAAVERETAPVGTGPGDAHDGIARVQHHPARHTVTSSHDDGEDGRGGGVVCLGQFDPPFHGGTSLRYRPDGISGHVEELQDGQVEHVTGRWLACVHHPGGREKGKGDATALNRIILINF